MASPDFITLDRDQGRLALYAVRDLIARRILGNNCVPPGMYRLCHELGSASVRGTETVAALKESSSEDLIDSAAAAAILQCSARWVRQIRTDLGGQNIGGRWIFRRQTVVDYADMKGGAR